MNVNPQHSLGDQLQANLGFVQRQTAYVEAGVYAHRYPDLRYPGMIPVDYSAPEWIKTIDYMSMDIAGDVRWTADRARDLNLVGAEFGKNSSDIFMADIGYDYGLEEIEQAKMLGVPLSGLKALAARTVYERSVDKIAFTGDVEKGWQGLYNHSAVTAAAALHGDWDNATAGQMLADVNSALTGIFSATNEIAMADTLIFPYLKLQKIASTPLNDNSDTTVLAFLKTANVFTATTGVELNIRAASGLNTAGVGNTSRLLAYRNSEEVLKMHIPMRHKFLPAEVRSLSYQIAGIYRIGKLDIRLPKEVRYVDGI